jgi:hypothetical protein
MEKIWVFEGCPCGKLLAEKLRSQIQFFIEDGEFGPRIPPDIVAAPVRISPRQIERRLTYARAKLKLKGKSTTKPGTLPKHQFPVRAYFTWDERKAGFFELDTVTRRGSNTSGHFCRTLTVTGVYSGWTEPRALLNGAHRRVKEAVRNVKHNIPFPMMGIDSDNGGEFINKQLIDWCHENHVRFTSGRPYRKNDNCFVERKNGDRVRKTIGYHRLDTEAEYTALAEVYRFTNPLVLRRFELAALTHLDKIRQEKERFLRGEDGGPSGLDFLF